MIKYITIPLKHDKNKYFLQIHRGCGGKYNLSPYTTLAILMDKNYKVIHFATANRKHTWNVEDTDNIYTGVKTAIQALFKGAKIKLVQRTVFWEQIVPVFNGSEKWLEDK